MAGASDNGKNFSCGQVEVYVGQQLFFAGIDIQIPKRHVKSGHDPLDQQVASLERKLEVLKTDGVACIQANFVPFFAVGIRQFFCKMESAARIQKFRLERGVPVFTFQCNLLVF